MSYSLVFDFETSKVPEHMPYHPNSFPTLLCTRRSDGTIKEWWFSHTEKEPSNVHQLQEIQNEFDGAIRIVGHNIKFDLHWLKAIGIHYDHLNLYCTQVAEYLIEKQQPQSLKLSELCKKYNIPNKLEDVSVYWNSGFNTDEVPAELLLDYCHRDVLATQCLFRKQIPILKKLNLVQLAKLEFELIKSIVEIEVNGLKLNTDLLRKTVIETEKQLQIYDQQLKRLLGVDINLGSNQQLSSALFGGKFLQDSTETITKYYKYGPKEITRKCKKEVVLDGIGFKPTGDVGKTGYYSVGADVITSLRCTNKLQKTVKKLLIERTKLSKLQSTYYEGFLNKEINGYLYPTINQTIAVTGRFTSSNPNGQNLPRGRSTVKRSIISRFET